MKKPDPFNLLLQNIEAYFSGRPISVGVLGIKKEISKLPQGQKEELQDWMEERFFVKIYTPFIYGDLEHPGKIDSVQWQDIMTTAAGLE